ncbi:MAG TPA: hypothetical protein VGZ25_05800, partial [Gemmataceae bacterium]|nr:hypothetical protein [Gemmataceae bacterium]
IGSTRADEPSDQSANRASIAIQKVEGELKDALLEVQKTSVKDPEKAKEQLKKVLSKLDDDDTLPEARRERYKRILKDQLRNLQLVGEMKVAEQTEKSKKESAKESRQTKEDKKADDGEEVNRRFKTIRDAFKDNKPEEASRQLKDLEKRYPNNPAVSAARRLAGVSENVDESRRFRRESSERIVGITREVERSSVAPANDVEFPAAKKWQELTEKRKKDNLTKAERAILKALDTPIKIDFKNAKLEEVIDFLQTTLDITISLDKAALERANVAYDTRVTKSFKRPVMAKTALQSILNELGLTYILRDEILEVMTPDMAKDLMVVRVYPVGELTLINPFGGIAFPLNELENAARLIELIKVTIEPSSWGEGGGTIAYEFGTHSLVIKQSALVHSRLGISLK